MRVFGLGWITGAKTVLPKKIMKKYDKVRFKYGFKHHTGTVLKIYEVPRKVRIRFSPKDFLWYGTRWMFYGKTYHDHVIIGRSLMGKFHDWKNK